MLEPRLIPVLLLNNRKLVKTINFKEEIYIGDPINAVKLFNEKNVDELMVVDIYATINNATPNFELLENMITEAYMPVTIGGGVNSIAIAEELIKIGSEKIVLQNQFLSENYDMINSLADTIGAQSVVISIDYIKRDDSYLVYSKNSNKSGQDLFKIINKLKNIDFGELYINNVTNDGLKSGQDYTLIENVSKLITQPLISGGGLSSADDYKKSILSGASAVAGSSFFLLKGALNGVLITYPTLDQRSTLNQEISHGM